jgi:hypothetical protein
MLEELHGGFLPSGAWCVDAGGIARRINRVWMLEALHGGLTVGRLAR